MKLTIYITEGFVAGIPGGSIIIGSLIEAISEGDVLIHYERHVDRTKTFEERLALLAGKVIQKDVNLPFLLLREQYLIPTAEFDTKTSTITYDKWKKRRLQEWLKKF